MTPINILSGSESDTEPLAKKLVRRASPPATDSPKPQVFPVLSSAESPGKRAKYPEYEYPGQPGLDEKWNKLRAEPWGYKKRYLSDPTPDQLDDNRFLNVLQLPAKRFLDIMDRMHRNTYYEVGPNGKKELPSGHVYPPKWNSGNKSAISYTSDSGKPLTITSNRMVMMAINGRERLLVDAMRRKPDKLLRPVEKVPKICLCGQTDELHLIDDRYMHCQRCGTPWHCWCALERYEDGTAKDNKEDAKPWFCPYCNSKPSDMESAREASHLCKCPGCRARDHIRYETRQKNLSRIRCKGTYKHPDVCECEPRCVFTKEDEVFIPLAVAFNRQHDKATNLRKAEKEAGTYVRKPTGRKPKAKKSPKNIKIEHAEEEADEKLHQKKISKNLKKKDKKNNRHRLRTSNIKNRYRRKKEKHNKTRHRR